MEFKQQLNWNDNSFVEYFDFFLIDDQSVQDEPSYNEEKFDNTNYNGTC